MIERVEPSDMGVCTHNHSDAVVEAACEAILALLREKGPQHPGDLEDVLCGEPDMSELVRGMVRGILPRFYHSPYRPALNRLVVRGDVEWWYDGDSVWYGLAQGAKP